jgi:Uma2 family endonuclease
MFDVLDAPYIANHEFDQFALLPENRDKRLELLNGRIIEVVSSLPSSNLAALILIYLGIYVVQHDLGHLTGADGGYMVGKERYIPDAAFVSKARQPELPQVAYNPIAPDLAIEVLSPTDNDADVRVKIIHYLQAGTAVWLFDPDDEHVEIYLPGKLPIRLSKHDTLDGGDVLPGFRLALKDVFRK